MDNGTIRPANNRVRKFPGYTLAQLEKMVYLTIDSKIRDNVFEEIAARKACTNVFSFAKMG